ncbi:hypothetical protein [Acidithrix sp. C25]|uniref:hypothetical protein n=1 Tax=Acidithrix sp. C25 TaxID=1671482 RepID=UPI001BBDB0AC|nr:hypothetical protein [Acidithrix sp. C25]CAG4909459.1 unnamed protein product [Acidithrix sp. C25]
MLRLGVENCTLSSKASLAHSAKGLIATTIDVAVVFIQQLHFEFLGGSRHSDPNQLLTSSGLGPKVRVAILTNSEEDKNHRDVKMDIPFVANFAKSLQSYNRLF